MLTVPSPLTSRREKQASEAFLQDTEKQLMFLSSLALSVEVYENTLEECTQMKVIVVQHYALTLMC